MIRIFTHVVTFVNASPPPSHLLCPSHFLGIPPSPNRQALPHSRLWPWLFPREYHRLLLIPQIFAHNETFSALFFISVIVSDILSLYISICSISIKEYYRLPSVLFPDVFLVHILCSINISWLVKWTLMSLRTPILDIGLASNHFPHPKRGWDKNGFPRRGSIYFFTIGWLILDTGQMSAWTQGSSVDCVVFILNKRGLERVGMRAEKSYLWPHFCSELQSAPGSLLPFGLRWIFCQVKFSTALDQGHHLQMTLTFQKTRWF